MSTPVLPPLGIHHPALIPPPLLLAEVTARDTLMGDLVATLEGGADSAGVPHALIVGGPGSGKTTVLHVLKHRIQKDKKLAGSWLPLIFDEKSYHIGDLTGFWLECLRLAEQALAQKGKVHHVPVRADQDHAIGDQARLAFTDLLSRTGHRALLLVDNLDEMLAAMGDETSRKSLRAFLQKEDQVRLVGTASAPFWAAGGEGSPLRQLFRFFQLDGFTADEMRAAFHAMADARPEVSRQIQRPTREDYWRGLHVLTGGSPRLLKAVYQVMERGVGPDFRAQLEGLLDACTADFKQRIASVSRQQQRVFDAIATAWDPVQISDISAGLRMGSNQISAQIQALVEAQLIVITGGSVKRKRYQVADRFINVCWFLRFSHSDRVRFDWFLRTMNILLAPDPEAEPLERLRELAAPRVGDGDRKLHAQLLAEAMRNVEADSMRLGEGLKGVRHLLKAEQGDASRELPGIPMTMELFAMEYDLVRHVANTSAEQRSKLGYQHTSSTWWCIVASEAGKLQKNSFVEQCAKKAVLLDPSNTAAWAILSAILLQKERPQESLDAARNLLSLTTQHAQSQLARALIVAARHQLPDQRAESEKMALELALQAPGELLSTLNFWRYLRTDVQACRLMLPLLFAALRDPSSATDAACATAHFLALGVSATLLVAGLDDELQGAIEHAGVQQALDTPLQVIRLRRDETLRSLIAPERLALVDTYLAEIEKRRAEMRRAGTKGGP